MKSKGVVRVEIPGYVKTLFNKVAAVAFATASSDADPNVVPIYWKKVYDGATLLVVDNFMLMTHENLLHNNKVCVSFWDSETEEGYKLKGVSTYHTEGAIFEAGKRFVLSKNPNRVPKGVVEIRVTEIFNITPGLGAGERI
ncbi:MAG: pyridoxamine 5'-phosphate oxidase family protein [Candidatus Woesearchaeota archaeon]